MARSLASVLCSLTLLLATPRQAPRRAVGCWTLSFAPWNPAVSKGDESIYRPLPDTVELKNDSAAAPSAHQYFQASRRPNRPPAILPAHVDSLLTFWRPLGSDSLEVWLPVWWSTGIRVRLEQRGDSLSGIASVYVDVIGARTPRSTVTGRRVLCARGA
jgi:hypothetical protein